MPVKRLKPSEEPKHVALRALQEIMRRNIDPENPLPDREALDLMYLILDNEELHELLDAAERPN